MDADNRGGSRNAALHLARLGYRRIGTITAPSNTTAGVDRRAGFLEGLAGAGSTADGRLYEGDWSEESGRRAMEQMLGSEPDAVFVASDRMAVGALAAMRAAGLRCPDDIALVSFDGLIPPSQTVPQLTSVAQPVTAVGERAAQLLHGIIRGDLQEPEQVVLPTELVVRESCGAVAGGAS